MKSKCSFILKASTALVLALLMLFGTVATSIAATVDDLAATSAPVWNAGTKYVYFLNTTTNWTTSVVQLVVGKSSYSSTYTMSKIANTNIYYVAMTDSWTDATYCAFIGNSSAWDSGAWGSSNLSNATKRTAAYTSTFTFNGNDHYLFTPNSASNGCTITPTYKSNLDAFKNNQTAYTYTATTPGGSYSASNTGGTVSVKGYYLSADNTASTSDAVSSGSGTSATYGSIPSCTVTMTASAKTNYQFIGWFDSTSATSAISTSTTYTYTCPNSTKSMYARFMKKPQISFTQSGATGTVKIGGTAQTSAYVNSGTSTTLDVVPPTGYTISSVTYTGTAPSWTTSTSTHYAGTVAPTADTTITVTYAEITGGVALTAYTDGAASTDGGTIQDGSGNNITSLSGLGVSSTGTAVSVVASSDYKFNGWQFSGDNATHIRYRFGTSGDWLTPAAGTTYGTSSNTTIYLKTDGTSGLTTANAVVQAMFIYAVKSVTVTEMASTDGTAYMTSKGNTFTFTYQVGSDAAVTPTAAKTYTVNGRIGETLKLTASTMSSYTFCGWYSASTPATTAALTVQRVSSAATYSFTLAADSNTYYFPLYRYNYVINFYDSYEYDYTNGAYTSTKTSAPPTTVVAKHTYGNVNASGTTSSSVTYTYDGTLATGTTSRTSTSTYGQGYRLRVLSGDTVTCTYNALSSSDMISAVFNGASTYSAYNTGVSAYAAPNFTSSKCLKAYAEYYTDPYATTISSQTYAASVTQNTHVVTWMATAAKYGITIDLGLKKRVFLSESSNIVVQSKNIDNFYEAGENMSGSTSTTYFTVKAAGNANLTNRFYKTATTTDGITYPGIKFYYCDQNGNFTTSDGVTPSSTPVEITNCSITVSGTSSANSGTTDGSAIQFTGTMPSTNVYIDLGLKQSVTVQHGSKMVSDTSTNAYVAWAKVAEIRVNANATASTSSSSVSGSGSGVGTLNNGYDSAAVVSGCSKTVEVGSGYISYVWDYWKPSSSNNNQTFSDSYMFVGWYKGDTTGPDYSNGFISDKEYLKYSPKENTVIWAVGTRDMYINGSANITGTTAWPTNNIKMEFDADYVNSDGGARGRYKYTITQTIFNTTGSTPAYTKGTLGGTSDGGTYFTSGGDTGNSYFKFYDAKTQSNDNLGTWSGIDTYYNQTGTNGLKFGKASYYNDKDNATNRKKYGQGFIEFSEASFPGYAAPLYIYYYPGKGFSVEASYVYINIYMSSGYAVGGTTRVSATTHSSGYYSTVALMDGTTERAASTSSSTAYVYGPIGNGWSPDHEGHVGHFQVKQKEATVRVKKVCASTEEVSAFFVYDLYANTVYAVRDVTASSNTYYADIKMINGHDLYIVPIIEEKTATMTVYFDATQLNQERWGKIVTCYAWYSDGSNSPALGAYPGQPMIPSDDGNTWVATFPDSYTSGGTTYTLAGITFSNYIDGIHSWLGCTDIMDGVTYTNAGTDTQTYTLNGNGKVHLYNAIGATSTTTKYEKVNCKVQTYDYRDPISYYTNFKNEGETDFTLTFSIKMGNSDDVMSLKHSELKSSSAKLFSSVPHTNSSGTSEPKKFTSSNFEYLTNAKKDLYVDINGNEIRDENGDPMKPTATYYVLAKGQVVYKNGSLTQVFWSGSRNESSSSLAYYNTNLGSGTNTVPTGTGAVNETYPLSGYRTEDITGVAENYGVEWYVYDASGNYITNVLAAGFADNSTTASDCYESIIGAKLKSMGYAVDGKAVAICYDKPRSLNTDDESGGTKYINSGTNFDAYRATGQWYKTTKTQPVTVTARVGMMTDSGEVVSENNSEGYGTATAAYISSRGSSTLRSVAGPTPLNSEYGAVTTALKDAENTPVRLTATSTNFIGWYYYDEGTGKFTKAKWESPTEFYPNYTKDITFYAMYRASAIYRYGFMGREGQKYYTVSGGDLTAAEMKAANAPATTRTDVTGSGGKAPVGKMTVFKQTLDFSKNASGNTYTASDYSNTRAEYYLDIANCMKTAETYTVTAYYKNASGTLTSTTVSAVYNGQALDLKNYSTQYKSKQFIGWYAYDGNTVGELLSTQYNFGMRLTRSQAIIARYQGESTLPTSADTWHAYIDENLVTREMYSADSGMFYNDTIVRVRNDQGVTTALPSGAEVGVIMISDNKSGDATTRTTAQLTTYANKLSNGQSGKINSTNLSATKACTTSVTKFNRADLAIRGDYSKMVGCCYSVYAYIKLSNGTYIWSNVVTRSDASTAYPAVPA